MSSSLPPSRHRVLRGRSARTVMLSTLASALILGAAWFYATETPGPVRDAGIYVPASDDEVVERLQRHSLASKRDLSERLARPADRPVGVAAAVAMAHRHYERARRDGEPRELGLAEAALGDWWEQADAPVPVLLLRAAIRQYQHDFAGALEDLRQAIVAEPGNAQAWLSQAAILQTTGHLKEAAESCRRLVAISDHIAGHVCLADLASLRGDQTAFDRLENLLTAHRAGPSERAWILTVQAEMAERLGRESDAQRLFPLAVAFDSGSYARVAYADYLLLHGRATEVAAVLGESPATDAVLLRRAIALARTADPSAKLIIDELRQRFESSVARDDSLHLREMARFALEIDGAADAALALAKRNWTLQKEPADALLLAAAAKAAGVAEGAEAVRAFVREPGLFDVRLDGLL